MRKLGEASTKTSAIIRLQGTVECNFPFINLRVGCFDRRLFLRLNLFFVCVGRVRVQILSNWLLVRSFIENTSRGYDHSCTNDRNIPYYKIILITLAIVFMEGIITYKNTGDDV